MAIKTERQSRPSGPLQPPKLETSATPAPAVAAKGTPGLTELFQSAMESSSKAAQPAHSQDFFGQLITALQSGAAQLPAVPAISAQAADGNPRQVVVYAAHPDDETGYAAGTIARLSRSGAQVNVVSLSHGEGGRILDRGPKGEVIERRDYSREHVVQVREEEVQGAAKAPGVEYGFLFPAKANVDFGWTTSPSEALEHWDAELPGGVVGALKALVADIRQRKPALIMTLDPVNDPGGSDHGHHKAVGVLVDLAARLAADPRVPGGEPFAVKELVTFAPKDQRSDLTVAVNPEDRRSALRSYSSQFSEQQLREDSFLNRTSEQFLVKWRAQGLATPRQGSVLQSLI